MKKQTQQGSNLVNFTRDDHTVSRQHNHEYTKKLRKSPTIDQLQGAADISKWPTSQSGRGWEHRK